MTILLPILVVLFLFLVLQINVIRIDRESRAQCRIELLHAQKKAGSSLTSLLSLNPAVRTAKIARAMAQAAMVIATAAGNPVAFAAAYRALTVAENSLRALKMRQQYLLAKAYFDLGQGLLRARNAMHEVWRTAHNTSAAPQQVTGRISFISPISVAVRPVLKSDPYPEYVLVENFEQQQSLQIFWSLQFQNTREISKWIPQNWSYDRGCGATLQSNAQNKSLRPKLSEARFFSKSFFFF